MAIIIVITIIGVIVEMGKERLGDMNLYKLICSRAKTKTQTE